MKIENKKIVLIGCTGNLGKPIYDFLDKSKNQIIILSRKCPHFLKDKKSKNFFKMDFSKEIDVKNAINFVKKRFKYPDLVVNGAYSREKKITQNDLLKNIKKNAVGYYLINKLFAEYMKKNKKGGSIAIINSIYSSVAPNFKLYSNERMSPTADYNFIKGGLISQTKFFATKYGKYKIRFNSISYGGIKNKIVDKKFNKIYSSRVPLGRMMYANEVGGILLFLASDHSNYITGNNIFVDGGYTCL